MIHRWSSSLRAAISISELSTKQLQGQPRAEGRTYCGVAHRLRRPVPPATASWTIGSTGMPSGPARHRATSWLSAIPLAGAVSMPGASLSTSELRCNIVIQLVGHARRMSEHHARSATHTKIGADKLGRPVRLPVAGHSVMVARVCLPMA